MFTKDLINNPQEISIYVHWPYCIKKCPYCDFNSYVSNNIDAKAWEAAYLQDLEYQSKFLAGKQIKTVFFGGGTPSLMDPEIVNTVIQAIIKLNKGKTPEEITLEVNPSSFEIAKFKQFKQALVSRVSIGVQSFNDEQLKYLGRVHSSSEALLAINAANEIFEYTSFDLINGLKNQSLSEWQAELKQAIPLVKSHISIYELTIEEGTAFYRQKQQAVNDDLGKQMLLYTIDELAKHNIAPYEISNYSKANHQSLHNLNYWRGGLYVGIGPGAHGRVLYNNEVIATSSHKNPNKWLELANSKDATFTEYAVLNKQERLLEILLSNVRLYEAISPLLINNLKPEALEFLIEEKLLLKDEENYYITTEGKLKLNSVILYLSDHIKN